MNEAQLIEVQNALGVSLQNHKTMNNEIEK